MQFRLVMLLLTIGSLAAATIEIPTDYTTIQAGIDAAVDGDTVLVLPDTYVENINFNGKDIIVGSQFLTTEDRSYIQSTVIDGNQNGPTVTINSGESSLSGLVGLSVTNGSGIPDGAEEDGGGIFCDGTSPRLSNLNVYENTAVHWGAGICLKNSNSIIENSWIHDNSIPGEGAGVALSYSNVTIRNTQFDNNVCDQRAGALFMSHSTAHCENLIVYSNSAIIGAAFSLEDSELHLMNSTVTMNTGSVAWLYSDGVTFNVTNSILWNENSDELDLVGSNHIININYSIIEGGYSGTNNLDINPLFVNPGAFDFHLSSSSPAIGAGTSTGIPATDFDGNPRPSPNGSLPDIGAFESNLSVPNSLVAYYPFNGNANDESGNGYNGTLNGSLLATDRFGYPDQAYLFDGIDDVIVLPLNVSGRLSFTHVMWAKLTDLEQAPIILHTEDGSIQLSPQLDRVMARDWPNRLGGSEPQNTIEYYSDSYKEAWTQFAVTCEYEQSPKLYINGQLVSEESFSDDPSGTYQGNSIGAVWAESLGEYQNFFGGFIDDIRIYRQVLSEFQIDSLYHLNGWPMLNNYIEIPQMISSYGDTVSFPVSAQFDPDSSYYAAELDFTGYGDGLEFLGIDTVGAMIGGLDWSWAENEVNDALQSAFAGSEAITGEGVFCYLQFQVVGEICTTVPVNIVYAMFNTTEVTDITNGSVYIEPTPGFGDVDMNGVVQAFDAAQVLLYAIDSVGLSCQQWYNGDANMDDTVDVMDASLILQFVVDSIDSLPVLPDEPAFLANGNLWFEEIGAMNGSPLSIPLHLEQGENIFAFEGSFSYDPAKMTFSDVIPQYNGFNIEIREPELGLVKFAAYRSHAEGTAEGVFTEILFLDVSLATGEETLLEMESFKLNHNRYVDVPPRSIVSIEGETQIPSAFTMNQNYPNPFNPTTTISYGLPESSKVTLAIYDVTGREINRLVHSKQNTGWYEVQWNGTTTDGTQVSTGLYFARVEAGSFTDMIKMVYLR